MQPSRDITRLLEIMAALRTPGSGCAWDLAQDFASIARYTLEEAYEVVDAIERSDFDDLRDELGDLLLQVTFHAQMASERAAFDFGDVVQAVTAKLVRRHPHVFNEARDLSPDAVAALWEKIKADEKTARKAARLASGLPREVDQQGALGGVPTALPGLTRAIKLQAKASTVGFDWNDARLVLAKIREETDEVEAALEGRLSADEIAGEIGDLLFAVANLARHVEVDPEAAVRQTNAKFERRFAYIESQLAARGRPIGEATLAEMDALWNAAKAGEG